MTIYPSPDMVRAVLMGLETADSGAVKAGQLLKPVIRLVVAHPPLLGPVGHAAQNVYGRCVYCGHANDAPCICESGSPDGCTGGNHGRGFEHVLPILSGVG